MRTLLARVLAPRRIAPPAIWGRLPAHADFVRSGMRHGESEGWSRWLAQESVGAFDGIAAAQEDQDDSAVSVEQPTAFVLPPGALSFAPRQAVFGVMVPSVDRAGRRHPLFAYQRAPRTWLQPRLDAAHSPVVDWLYWLTRAVLRHAQADGTTGGEGLPALLRTVQALWALHSPRMVARMGEPVVVDDMCERVRACEAVLGTVDATGGLSHRPYASRVASMRPAADRLKHLFRDDVQSAFWQQDVEGHVLRAASRLQALQQMPTAVAMMAPSVETTTPQAGWRDLALLRDLDPALAQFDRSDPFATLGLSRTAAPDAADMLGVLLSERPAPMRVVEAPPPPVDATADTLDASASQDEDGYVAENDIVRRLHAEFLRVVRDAEPIAVQTEWQPAAAPSVNATPGLEDPAHADDGASRPFDVLPQRGDRLSLIDDLDETMGFELLAPEVPPDILHLFAPELPPGRRTELPLLTLREHHALSPDSHMPVTCQPDPTAPSP